MPGLTEAFEAICTQRNCGPWFYNQAPVVQRYQYPSDKSLSAR